MTEQNNGPDPHNQPQQPGPPPGYQQGPPPGYQQGPPPGYQQGPPPGFQPAPPVRPEDERLWSTLGHAGAIILGWVAPLIVWLIYKDRSRFIGANAKEALNFQLTLMIASIISAVLTMVFVGFVLLPLVWIANLVFCILAAVASNRGEVYRYPVTIRMIS